MDQSVIAKSIADWSTRQSAKTIAITGNGASGKSALADAICSTLTDGCNLLYTDPYLVSSELRRLAGANGRLTACHPEATFMPALERDMQSLRSGHGIWTVEDFGLPSQELPPNRLTVVEGIAAAFVSSSLIDASIFVYCDEDEEMRRRLERDVKVRGQVEDKIRKDFAIRRAQFEQYVWPVRSNCHMVLKSLPNYEFVVEQDSLGIIRG